MASKGKKKNKGEKAAKVSKVKDKVSPPVYQKKQPIGSSITDYFNPYDIKQQHKNMLMLQ